jgi:hypothetical protein
MAGVVEEFVQRGIPRESITPEMVMAVLEPADDKIIDVNSRP